MSGKTEAPLPPAGRRPVAGSRGGEESRVEPPLAGRAPPTPSPPLAPRRASRSSRAISLRLVDICRVRFGCGRRCVSTSRRGAKSVRDDPDSGHDPFLPGIRWASLPRRAQPVSQHWPGDGSGGTGGRLTATAVEALPEGPRAALPRAGRQVKLGIDPTAPDIHLGHVVVLDKLRQFQDAGHTVVLIIGISTARVGDPSGVAVERPVLSAEEIEANAATFQEQAFKVLERDRTEVRRTAEWLDMGTEELFALLRRFTIARLLERDDFERRMAAEQPISVLELLYLGAPGLRLRRRSLRRRARRHRPEVQPAVRARRPGGPRRARSRSSRCRSCPAPTACRMSKSLGNYVGVAEPPEEVYREADEHPRRRDGGVPAAAARGGRGGRRRAAGRRSATSRGGSSGSTAPRPPPRQSCASTASTSSSARRTTSRR